MTDQERIRVLEEQLRLAKLGFRDIYGPFYLRMEAGAGHTSLEHSRPFEGIARMGRGWVQGVELGLASDTPFGSFSIGVGVATTDRPIFKVSLGS